MSQTVTIQPVSRIEGHAKITIQLGEQGEVSDARFHVNEFRGFEKFCEGRLMWEMPGISSRICGICPSSHLVASAKAGDEILAIGIPETAEKLRRLLTLAQWTQSHALSFFLLCAPDFLLGFDSEPAKRNVFGLLEKHEDLVRRGIRLRKFGQEIIEILGGRKIHTPWAVAGGVREPLQSAEREKILAWLPEVKETARLALGILKRVHEELKLEVPSFGNFRTLSLGFVSKSGALEYYGGHLRVRDGDGNTLADKIEPRDYLSYFGEITREWSYLKFPYYKPLGPEKGIYRVGPLARLNVCDYIDTPEAEAERKIFMQLGGNSGAVNNSFYYHYARLIEVVFAIEKIEQLVADPAILGKDIRASAMINRAEGVGACEAPRGTLFHHYKVDSNGVLKNVNMLIATAQNNLAINRTVRQLAVAFLDGAKLREGLLNRIEAGVRCFDPCLSCSTHAVGQMPLHVQLVDPSGALLDEARRG